MASKAGFERIAKQDGIEPLVDVIFVHGLGGDYLSSWEQPETGFSWLNALALEPKFAVWSVKHEAAPYRFLGKTRGALRGLWGALPFTAAKPSSHGADLSLPDRAEQLRHVLAQSIDSDGIGKRPIIWVGHSLGGLLVKQILRKAQDRPNCDVSRALIQNSHTVFTLGTPHTGASLATWARCISAIVGTKVAVKQLERHDPALKDLYSWYCNNATHMGIRTVSYAEGKPVSGVAIVVDENSAFAGTGETVITLDEDHVSIAKPVDRSCDQYLHVENVAKQLLGEPSGLRGTAGDGLSREVIIQAEHRMDRHKQKGELSRFLDENDQAIREFRTLCVVVSAQSSDSPKLFARLCLEHLYSSVFGCSQQNIDEKLHKPNIASLNPYQLALRPEKMKDELNKHLFDVVANEQSWRTGHVHIDKIKSAQELAQWFVEWRRETREHSLGCLLLISCDSKKIEKIPNSELCCVLPKLELVSVSDVGVWADEMNTDGVMPSVLLKIKGKLRERLPDYEAGMTMETVESEISDLLDGLLPETASSMQGQ